MNAAQIQALPDGRAVHTRIEPFGCVTVYKIKPADTLFDLAEAFRVNGASLTLYQWNASVVGRNPNLIRPGQVIIVDPTGRVTAS